MSIPGTRDFHHGLLAGATLAKGLAERGVRVLVLERETEFKDRVRGEQMHPWGVAEAKALGIYDRLIEAGGHQTRYWTTWLDGVSALRRDLDATTPHGVGSFNVYHPAMQATLLTQAAESGAEVRRGVRVEGVEPGISPRVTARSNGRTETLQARLVVAADGRGSQARSWGEFQVNRDPERLIIAGTIVANTPLPDDSVHLFVSPSATTLWAPLGDGRARTYFIYSKSHGERPFSGPDRVPTFLSACRQTGVPDEWLDGAELPGPLAQFNGADHWVTNPTRKGLALVGDAAACSDPSWGTGLSLTLLDVRHLRDALLATDDWDRATADYAKAHDDYYGVLHQIEGWMADLIWDEGSEADTRRERAMPRLLSDPTGLPDIIGLGPASPNDESARRLLMGEDLA